MPQVWKPKGNWPGSSMRVEICGGIAAGKTTLAMLMRRAGFEGVFENFRSIPFLEAFYSDPRRYAFETELSFLLQHYNQIKVNGNNPEITVCDYSLYLDLAYARITLKAPLRRAFSVVYNTAVSELSPPTLLIYLRCSAETELKRIRRRRRIMERSISVEYLKNINNSLDLCVKQAKESTKILEVNSEELDFAHDPLVQDKVLDLVCRSLGFRHKERAAAAISFPRRTHKN